MAQLKNGKMDILAQWESQGVSAALLKGVRRYREEFPLTAQESSVGREPPELRYVYYGREIIESTVAALLAGENLLLAGAKATGKNVLAENLATAFWKPAWTISFHIDMDAAYLLGTDTFKEGEVRFRPGPVYECAAAGGFGILDEINMARNEALAVLHSLLDFRRKLEVPGHGRLSLHPAARFIATMNHGYAGTRDLNEALASRFAVLQMPELSETILTEQLRTEFPGIREQASRALGQAFLDLQEKARQGEISDRPVDLRGLLTALRLLRQGLKAREALALGIVNKCFETEERQLVRDVLTLWVPDDWRAEDVFDE